MYIYHNHLHGKSRKESLGVSAVEEVDMRALLASIYNEQKFVFGFLGFADE